MGSETMRILHISDLHIDWFYQEGAEAHCQEPVCCRKNDGQVKEPAGKWGTVQARCEVPLNTVEKIFEWISKNEKFDAVYWTGDLPTHSVWNQTRDGQLQKLDVLTSLFEKYFKGKHIFSTVGNHESSPVDSFPSSIPSIPVRYRSYWLYDKLAQQWATFLPDATLETYNDIYNWAYLNQTDPDGVLEWLGNRLQDAENIGDKVHIIGHEHSCSKKWKSNDLNFWKIINRYESTISGLFFGHTHKDEFKVIFDMSGDEPRATAAMFIAGSITTYAENGKHAHNPSYKIYTIDARPNGTWGVLDFESKYVDIGESNRQHMQSPVVKFQYNATAAYNLDALFPANMYNLYEGMKKSDTVLHQYIKFLYSSYAPSVNACDAHCRMGFLHKIASQLPK